MAAAFCEKWLSSQQPSFSTTKVVAEGSKARWDNWYALAKIIRSVHTNLRQVMDAAADDPSLSSSDYKEIETCLNLEIGTLLYFQNPKICSSKGLNLEQIHQLDLHNVPVVGLDAIDDSDFDRAIEWVSHEQVVLSWSFKTDHVWKKMDRQVAPAGVVLGLTCVALIGGWVARTYPSSTGYPVYVPHVRIPR